jgi:hypothetical protein
MSLRNFTTVAGTLAILCMATLTASAATTYTTGFEDFTLGPISSGGSAQNGWSGGASPDFTNNDAGDEQIVNTIAHTGAQSWHYARGYNSPGQGTPYTPSVSPAVANVGDYISGSVWFKAHTVADGSLLALETGNVGGTDRAEILAYIDNIAGGLTIRSFTGASAFTSVPIASGLDASVWHELAFSLTRTATENAVSISVDGGAPVNFAGSLKGFRDDNAFAYSESNSLKFRARHADGDPSFNGFYIDDVSYAVGTVPEPASLALAGAAVIGLFVVRRRQR